MIRRLWDKFCNFLAWHLPKRVAYHAIVRVGSYGTVGKYGDTVVSELTVLNAMNRWCDDHQLS